MAHSCHEGVAMVTYLALEVAKEHLGKHGTGLVRVSDILERLGRVTA